MNHIFKIFQYLSIDVALGSVGSSVLAVRVLDAEMPISYWFILPLCVWIIYTSDHLLDALKVKENAKMGRHYFHFLHRKTIAVFLFMAGVLSIVLIFKYLDREVIMYGFCIYFLILTYLLMNHFINRVFRFFPREIVIAIGYMAGTWGIPLLSKYPFISRTDLLFLLSHFLIIMAIPLLYSIYEYDADRIGGFISFATTFGAKFAGAVVLIILAISTAISVTTLFLIQHGPGLSMILMSSTLFVVMLFRKKFFVNDNYRTVSESISFLPFLLLLK